MTPHRRRTAFALGSTLFTLVSGWSLAASALQPLATFVGAARESNPDAREARATRLQREAEVRAATGRLLPSLAANGTYTRNQYEAVLNLPASLISGSAPGATGTGATPAGTTSGPDTRLVIQPYDQLDGNITLSVPVVDVAAWERRAAAKDTARAAAASEQLTLYELDRQVVEAYYQLLANEAVVTAAAKSLEVAHRTAGLSRDKKEGGTASELDVQRAVADEARADQDVASADFGAANARRALETLSGVAPQPSASFPEDDLHDEGALEGWFGVTTLPQLESARSSRELYEQNAAAAQASFYPTLTATAQERFTNATGFTGHPAYYVLQATLSFRLDATLSPTLTAQKAAADAARAREDKIKRESDDHIFQAFHQVRTDVAAARAARAQVTSTALAASLAEDRYESGIATQLDLIQAQKDAFRADVARIQADADLSYARAALRLASGLAAPRSAGDQGAGNVGKETR